MKPGGVERDGVVERTLGRIPVPRGRSDTGSSLADRIDVAEEQLYYCLTGLEEHALRLADEADAAQQPELALQARLIATDVVSRMGQIDRAKEWQLRLHVEAASGTALERRAARTIATTCARRGERSEAMQWVSLASAGWPEDDHPAWRAEALMVFVMISASTRHVDYTLARHAAVAVRAHCSPLVLSCTLANFAELAAECGDLEIASGFAVDAQSVIREHPEVTATLTLDSIARSLLLNGRTDDAIAMLEDALALETRIGCSDVLGDPWLTYAEALLARGDAAESLRMLDAPRRSEWAGKSTWTRSRDQKQRALALARLQRWEEAFAALMEHMTIYEVMRSIEGDRITVESQALQIVDEERHRAARFEHLALTDPLTGLPNRRQVDSWLTEDEGSRHIAIVDLDHFKRVNDTYSHAAGDQVLRQVAEVLQAAMFPSARDGAVSRVGRLGGEEFIVVWTNVQEEVVLTHAERLLEHLRSTRFPQVDPALVVTASIGLALHRVGVSSDLLLTEADRWLYVAKDGGRDQVAFTRGGGPPREGRPV